MNRNWLSLDKSNVVEMRCFLNEFQEPYLLGDGLIDRYVMLNRTRNTPLFDPRFINYGYNKVQFIEHLRYLGYKFLILTKSFAVDMPHRNSRYKSKFLGENGTSTNMDHMYSVFREELKAKYPMRQRLPICASKKAKNLYKNLSF